MCIDVYISLDERTSLIWNPICKVLQNLKLFKHQHDPTLENSTPGWEVMGCSQNTQAYYKCCLKLPSAHVCKINMKEKWILCWNMGPLPKKSHYVYANSPKLGEKKSETLLVPSTMGKGCSTYECTVLIHMHSIESSRDHTWQMMNNSYAWVQLSFLYNLDLFFCIIRIYLYMENSCVCFCMCVCIFYFEKGFKWRKIKTGQDKGILKTLGVFLSSALLTYSLWLVPMV
jgi:hypothetical protein